MKLNCKPGDLARIKAPFMRFRDLIVTVERAAIFGEYVRAKNGDRSFWGGESRAAWVCNANNSAFPCVIADECLSPIRDQGDDAQDESLSWLPVPSTVKEVA